MFGDYLSVQRWLTVAYKHANIHCLVSEAAVIFETSSSVFWTSCVLKILLNDDLLSDPSTEFHDDLKNSDNLFYNWFSLNLVSFLFVLRAGILDSKTLNLSFSAAGRWVYCCGYDQQYPEHQTQEKPWRVEGNLWTAEATAVIPCFCEGEELRP